MFDTLYSALSAFGNGIKAAVLVVVLPVASFFGHQASPLVATDVVTAPSTTATSSIPAIATTSSPRGASTIPPALASTTTAAVPIKTDSKPIKVAPKVPKAVPVAPHPQSSVPVQPLPSESTSTEVRTVGTTTIAVRGIPLLLGGTVHAGQSVPIAYLQMTNIGSEGMLLTGFRITQNGSAPTQSIIGLSTIDDEGGSRGSVGGAEGSVLFQNGSALAPTDAYFAPGQMRLFTVKATMTRNVSPYLGTTLMIDVTGLETTATVRDAFPIRGTTWTIAE